MGKCPICNEELIRGSVVRIAGSIAEDRESCPKNHYIYEYTYGNTRYFIGDKQFCWHYMNSPKHVRKIKNKMNEAIENLKLNY